MYVSKNQLEGFAKYKYSCIDTSPVSIYILQPFWTKVVEYVPVWLAANVLTLIGFLLLVIQFIVLWVYDPLYKSAELNHVPSWLWWLSALFHFTAHTLDGIDGKQARRTKTSSPLGEFFDHGLDSWSSSFITSNIFCLFKAESFSFVPGGYVGMLCLAQFAIITPHWEKYNTGVMVLPWSLDFSMLVITISYMITAVFGTSMWEDVMIFNNNLSTYIWIIVLTGTFLVGLPFSIYTILSANTNGTGRNLSYFEGLLPLVSPFISFILMLSINSLVPDCNRQLTYLMGVVFSNIMCRLIICQMTHTRCEIFNKLFYILIVCLISLYFTFDENVKCNILILTCTVTTLAHIHYGVVVVRTLAKHFEIWIFSIKPEQNDEKESLL